MPILIRGSGGRSLKLQPKEVTPTKSEQIITPDSAHDGLSRVTVNPIPDEYIKPSRTYSADSYTPSTSPQTIPAGTYCSGTQTIQGDSDLIASNIKSGVSIFGVNGSYKANPRIQKLSGTTISLNGNLCFQINVTTDNLKAIYFYRSTEVEVSTKRYLCSGFLDLIAKTLYYTHTAMDGNVYFEYDINPTITINSGSVVFNASTAFDLVSGEAYYAVAVYSE